MRRLVEGGSLEPTANIPTTRKPGMPTAVATAAAPAWVAEVVPATEPRPAAERAASGRNPSRPLPWRSRLEHLRRPLGGPGDAARPARLVGMVQQVLDVRDRAPLQRRDPLGSSFPCASFLASCTGIG